MGDLRGQYGGSRANELLYWLQRTMFPTFFIFQCLGAHSCMTVVKLLMLSWKVEVLGKDGSCDFLLGLVRLHKLTLKMNPVDPS